MIKHYNPRNYDVYMHYRQSVMVIAKYKNITVVSG